VNSHETRIIRFNDDQNSQHSTFLRIATVNDLVTCSVCGDAHSLDASELTFQLPDVIHAFPEAERAARCDVTALFR
jgi:hypothetical protein